jgi:hypothetical protein
MASRWKKQPEVVPPAIDRRPLARVPLRAGRSRQACADRPARCLIRGRRQGQRTEEDRSCLFAKRPLLPGQSRPVPEHALRSDAPLLPRAPSGTGDAMSTRGVSGADRVTTRRSLFGRPLFQANPAAALAAWRGLCSRQGQRHRPGRVSVALVCRHPGTHSLVGIISRVRDPVRRPPRHSCSPDASRCRPFAHFPHGLLQAPGGSRRGRFSNAGRGRASEQRSAVTLHLSASCAGRSDQGMSRNLDKSVIRLWPGILRACSTPPIGVSPP